LDNNELIDLDNTASVAANDLAKTVPSDSPRFTFYAYDQGDSDPSFGRLTIA